MRRLLWITLCSAGLASAAAGCEAATGDAGKDPDAVTGTADTGTAGGTGTVDSTDTGTGGSDTGSGDTGTGDTGTGDTGTGDTGTAGTGSGTDDTGTDDTGTDDTGTEDTGTDDAGTEDTGTEDTGTEDTGSGTGDPPEPGDFCGGFGALGCPPGQFCDYGPGCGFADQGGTCKAQPEACMDLYDPVCGCDGQTWSNGCYAHAAGVSVASEGECGSDDPVACGGWLGDTCSKDEFCNYQPGQTCGWADASAWCAKKPEICTALYDPVCGCDSKTYGNACTANAAGVGVLSTGPCATPP